MRHPSHFALLAAAIAFALVGCSPSGGDAPTAPTTEPTTTAATAAPSSAAASGIDPKAAATLRAALEAGATGNISSRATAAMVSTTGTQGVGMCSQAGLLTDDAGTALATEQLISSGGTDVSATCQSATPVAHYIVIGTDAYIEIPVGSGTWQHGTASGDVLSVLTSSSGPEGMAAQRAVLDAANSMTASDGGSTVVMTLTDLSALGQLLTANGMDSSVLAAVDSGKAQYTYTIDPDTGRVLTLDSVVTMEAQGEQLVSANQVSIDWSPFTIDAPAGATPNGATYATADELVAAAAGTS